MVMFGVSVLALLVGILDFALIVGAVPIPVPGLVANGQQQRKDIATYSFEAGTNGWTTRGAATNAVTSDVHAFSGHQALEFQVTDVSTSHQAFVYVARVPDARPGTTVVAHLYVPAGGPTLVTAIYALDKSYAWHSGPYPAAKPGEWTAVTYKIPQSIPKPVRELGLIIVGIAGQPPYTGPLFLDSVDLR
jgi:hypothetical protein